MVTEFEMGAKDIFGNADSTFVEKTITGVGLEDKVLKDEFKIYPNPADEELYIQFKKAFTGPVQYTIYSSLGSVVLEGDILTGSYSIDVRELSSGLFILNLSTDGENYSSRFVIRR